MPRGNLPPYETEHRADGVYICVTVHGYEGWRGPFRTEHDAERALYSCFNVEPSAARGGTRKTPTPTPEPATPTQCPDCGKDGETAGHQDCPFPQDHD